MIDMSFFFFRLPLAFEAHDGLTLCAMASLGPYAFWPFQLPTLRPPKAEQSKRVWCFNMKLSGKPEGMVVAGKEGVPGVVVLNWGQSEVIQQWQRDNRRLEECSVLLEVNGICHLQGMLDELQQCKDLRLLVSLRASPTHLSAFKEALFKGQWDLWELLFEHVLLEPGEICAICHADLSSGVRLACGHHFHTECAKKWLKRKWRCPLCNLQLKTSGNELHQCLVARISTEV